MTTFLEEWALFRQLAPELRKALTANNIKDAKKAAAMPALLALVNMAFNSRDEKVKLTALKELLGISGHGPVQKSAVGTMTMDGMTDAEVEARLSSVLDEVGALAADTTDEEDK